MAPDPDARLRAQMARLRSDERVRERAASAAELTPEESLAATYALCRWAAFFLARLPPEEAERAREYHEPLPPDSAPVLRRLARLASPGRPPR